MASKSSVEIKIIAQDDASAPIENVIDKTKELGAENRKVTKQSKKDWGGLGDLFGKILPRDMQGLIRGFKGTQRQVGRLSKSFKALRAAWASIGIGLILIALEELISNWDTVSDAIMGVTKEQQRQEKVNKEVYAAQVKLTTSVEDYITAIAKGELTDEERAVAIEKVNAELGNAITLTGDSALQVEQASKLLAAHLDLIDKESDARSSQNTIAEETIKLQEDEWNWYTITTAALGAFGAAEILHDAIQRDRVNTVEELKEGTEDRTQAELESNTVLNRLFKENEDRLAAEAKAEEKAAEAKRNAEAQKKKDKAKAAADEKFLTQERLKFTEAARIREQEGEEAQAIESLRIQAEKDLKALDAAGGNAEDLKQITDQFLRDKADIELSYKEEREALAEQDKLDAEADALELKTQLQTDEQNELDALALFFEEKRALVKGDMEQYVTLVNQEAEQEEAIRAKYRNKEEAERKKEQNAKIAGAIAYGNAVRGVMGSLGDLMEENSKEQKALAITEVLLAQAISIAQAIKAANTAGSNTGVAAPVVTPLLVIQMVGSVLAGFVGVKKILNEAGASGGGGVSGGSFGGGGGSSVASMASNVQVPLPARLDSPDAMQAYVVQSQLDGQLQSQAQLQGQVVL